MEPNAEPSPVLFFETVQAYQKTAALKGAIELGLFTAIGRDGASAREVAERCNASERGSRILCDFLVIGGFLTKRNGEYQLTQDTAVFLDKRSPAYVGGMTEFLLAPELVDHFSDIATLVREGKPNQHGGTVSHENPVWVKFARAMMPMMAGPAQAIAELVDPSATEPVKVLDIAAGHGLFGIAFALRNPNAHVTALDWAPVLEVASENAREAHVEDRYKTLPGSAFDVEFGAGYNIALLTNFLHHFDRQTCEALLTKVRSSLASGGRAAALEFVPNEDRVTPPPAAIFSMTMLASTPSGDAYTYAELDSMFRAAGFARTSGHPVPHSVKQVIIAET